MECFLSGNLGNWGNCKFTEILNWRAHIIKAYVDLSNQCLPYIFLSALKKFYLPEKYGTKKILKYLPAFRKIFQT